MSNDEDPFKWEMYCKQCGFKGEICQAMSPRCPKCKSRMYLRYLKILSKEGLDKE